MQPINAVSLAPAVQKWLENLRHPRILHIFDNVCNLINDQGEILSIVTPEIGNGPFNLVIEEDALFPGNLDARSHISIFTDQLQLGDLTIIITNAKPWSPLPDWETLHAKRVDIHTRLQTVPIPDFQFPNTLASSLANADLSSSITSARQLAGLGSGLTPSGDDFILGAILAVWIIHLPEVAGTLAKEITGTTAPLTTSLSAAWLRSTGKGEAGILWHTFFDTLVSGKAADIQLQITKILSVGETSGADALSGFLGTLVCWGKNQILDNTYSNDRI